MDQIMINTSTKTQVNSINPYYIKYQGPYKLHTWKKNVLDVYAATKEWEKFQCNMMEN